MNGFLCQSFWVKTSRASSRLDNPQFYSSIVYKLDQWSLHSICGNRSARQTAAERRRPAGAHLSPRKRKPQPAWGGDGQKKICFILQAFSMDGRLGGKKKYPLCFPSIFLSHLRWKRPTRQRNEAVINAGIYEKPRGLASPRFQAFQMSCYITSLKPKWGFKVLNPTPAELNLAGGERATETWHLNSLISGANGEK